MPDRAKCTEAEYRDAIRSFLGFRPEFCALADRLVGEIFATSGNWPEASDPGAYAERQTIAWLRHNVTNYDEESCLEFDDLCKVGPRTEEHMETCPQCQAGATCKERDTISESETGEENYRRRTSLKQEPNDEAWSILHRHRARGGSHSSDCRLCVMLTDA